MTKIYDGRRTTNIVKGKRYRLGLAGVGNIGREYLGYLLALEDISVAAVCDTNEDARHWAASRIGALEFTNYLDMLESGTIDIVFVCTPHHVHAQIVLDAMRHGIHVFKEKPLAQTLPDAYLLIRGVETYGVKLGVSAQRRFHPTYSRAKQALERLGRVFLVHAQYLFDSQPRDFGWRGKRAIAGGGAILDTGYHMIDLVCLYFGLPSEVFAYSTAMARPEIQYDTEDSALISFQYSDGMMGSILVSRAAVPRDEQISIYGTRGTLSVTRTDMLLIDKDGSIAEHITAARCWEVAFREQFRDFLTSVTSGREPKSNASTHIPTMAFMEAAYNSQQHHMPVEPSVDCRHKS